MCDHLKEKQNNNRGLCWNPNVRGSSSFSQELRWVLRFSLYSFTAVFLSVCFKVLAILCVCMCACVSECAHVHRSLQGLERDVRCPGQQGKLWGPWHGCWEQNSRSLQEQQLLSTTEASTQPHTLVLLFSPKQPHFTIQISFTTPWLRGGRQYLMPILSGMASRK